ncbi:Enoyl-CoA hydratase [Pseudoalteromonas luteoviolacea B = ATCC 29581]|nr:Enoyl-CoA hydratase [Pseudoalteromonas luteoviolacea B = ATCC 29581]
MINLDVVDQVAWVTLQRPEKQNALSFEMFKSLDKIAKQLKKDKQLRAVVIQGSGEHFSSGLDVKSVVKSPSKILQLLWKWLPGNANLVQRVVLRWQALPVPVFALIRGNCLGGGLQIALGCDFRIASSDARFAILESRWGLCPDMGATIHLPAQLNYDDALWLSMSAETISAKNAKEIGLITHLCDDPKARCIELIAQLSERSPDALAKIKALCQHAYHSHERTLLSKETLSQIQLLGTKNTRIVMKNNQTTEHMPFAPRK